MKKAPTPKPLPRTVKQCWKTSSGIRRQVLYGAHFETGSVHLRNWDAVAKIPLSSPLGLVFRLADESSEPRGKSDFCPGQRWRFCDHPLERRAGGGAQLGAGRPGGARDAVPHVLVSALRLRPRAGTECA